MADEPAALPGKPDAAPAVQSDGVPGAGAGNTDAGEKVVLGKHEFKSIEDAGKSYEESVRALNIAKQEAAALRKENEATKQAAAQAELLKTIAANTARQEPAYDFDAHVKTMAEKYDVPEGLAREMLTTTNGWVSDVERKAEERIAAVEAALAKQVAELGAGQQQLRPDYLAHKDMVDRFTANGMNFEAAIVEAKSISRQLPPEHPDRVDPPAQVLNNHAPDAGKASEPYLTAEDRMRFKAQGLTDEALDEMDADYKRRVATRAREAEVMATGGRR